MPFSCRSKLGHNAAFMQIPIGLEHECKGVVDIVRQKALYFEGSTGLVSIAVGIKYLLHCVVFKFMFSAVIPKEILHPLIS